MGVGAPKGSSNNPNGRTKGVPNKATTQAREAIADFVDGNADKLGEWLDKIAVDSPKDAFACFMSVVEYHIPKLARTESDVNIKGKLEISGILAELDGRSAGLPVIEQNQITEKVLN